MVLTMARDRSFWADLAGLRHAVEGIGTDHRGTAIDLPAVLPEEGLGEWDALARLVRFAVSA
jgi:hypothetical protein